MEVDQTARAESAAVKLAEAPSEAPRNRNPTVSAWDSADLKLARGSTTTSIHKLSARLRLLQRQSAPSDGELPRSGDATVTLKLMFFVSLTS